MPTSQNVRAVHDHLRASANQVWTWYAFTFYEQLHIIFSAGPSLISAIVLFTQSNSKQPLLDPTYGDYLETSKFELLQGPITFSNLH